MLFYFIFGFPKTKKLSLSSALSVQHRIIIAACHFGSLRPASRQTVIAAAFCRSMNALAKRCCLRL